MTFFVPVNTPRRSNRESLCFFTAALEHQCIVLTLTAEESHTVRGFFYRIETAICREACSACSDRKDGAVELDQTGSARHKHVNMGSGAVVKRIVRRLSRSSRCLSLLTDCYGGGVLDKDGSNCPYLSDRNLQQLDEDTLPTMRFETLHD